MRSTRSSITLATLLALGTALPLSAQVPWDAPAFLSPAEPGGLGVHWLDYGTLRDDGTGFLVTWKGTPFPADIRVRGGFAEGAEGEDAVFGGVELSRGLTDGGMLPIALAWTVGGGASAGEWLLVSIPMGITAGRAVTSGDIRFEPYVAPRVVLDGRFGDEAPGDEFAIAFSLEIGASLAFDQRGRFLLRGGASLGDRHAVGIGFVVGPGR